MSSISASHLDRNSECGRRPHSKGLHLLVQTVLTLVRRLPDHPSELDAQLFQDCRRIVRQPPAAAGTVNERLIGTQPDASGGKGPLTHDQDVQRPHTTAAERVTVNARLKVPPMLLNIGIRILQDRQRLFKLNTR